MTTEEANQILMFMGRADLKGNEAVAFLQSVNLVKSLAQKDADKPKEGEGAPKEGE